MSKLTVNSCNQVKQVFAQYPDSVRNQMLALRELILETAHEMDEISTIEETLKWGEPSYLTKYGSTLRMDWKAKTPHQYALYFKCTSLLVKTFRELFNSELKFEGNRAIVFQLTDSLPKNALKSCIKTTFRYHKVKQLPMLGLEPIQDSTSFS